MENRSEGGRENNQGREGNTDERFRGCTIGQSRQHLRFSIVELQSYPLTSKLGAQSLPSENY